MDALKDIWASLVSGVRERTTNPLSFAFLASWSAWNFRFFIVLLGDGTTTEKLKYIETLYPAVPSTYLGGLVFPLLSALAYVFVYPYISAFAIKFYRAKQVTIANAVKGLEEMRLLTPEDSAKLTRRHEAARRLWDEKQEELNGELQALRDALDKAEAGADAEVKAEALAKAKAELTESQQALEQELRSELSNLSVDLKAKIRKADEEAEKNRVYEADRRKWAQHEDAMKAQLDSLHTALDRAQAEIASATKAKVDALALKDVANTAAAIDGGTYGEPDEFPDYIAGAIAALSPFQKSLLVDISETADGIQPKVWATDNKRNYTFVLDALEKLKNMDLCEYSRGGRWRLTELGKEVAIALLVRN